MRPSLRRRAGVNLCVERTVVGRVLLDQPFEPPAGAGSMEAKSLDLLAAQPPHAARQPGSIGCRQPESDPHLVGIRVMLLVELRGAGRNEGREPATVDGAVGNRLRVHRIGAMEVFRAAQALESDEPCDSERQQSRCPCKASLQPQPRRAPGALVITLVEPQRGGPAGRPVPGGPDSLGFNSSPAAGRVIEGAGCRRPRGTRFARCGVPNGI